MFVATAMESVLSTPDLQVGVQYSGMHLHLSLLSSDANRGKGRGVCEGCMTCGFVSATANFQFFSSAFLFFDVVSLAHVGEEKFTCGLLKSYGRRAGAWRARAP